MSSTHQTAFETVREFVPALGLPVPDRPAVIADPELLDHRLKVLEEEVRELRAAAEAGDLVKVADGLADVNYANAVNAHLFGVDLDVVTAEVHRSNLTKVGPDGKVSYADGRMVKPDTYEPPNIAALLG